MGVPLPQLQPKSYTPKPAFAEPPAKTPVTLKTPKGTKPGQQTSPYRINPPIKPPLPAATAAGAGATAGGIGIGSALASIGGAIAIVLFFDEPLSKDQGNVPQPPEPSQPIEPPTFPFKGGQDPNRDYEIICTTTSQSYFSPPDVDLSGGAIRGKVTSVQIKQVFVRTDSNGRPRYTHTVEAINDKGQLFEKRIDPGNGEAKDAYIFKKLVPLGNEPDNFGDPPPTSPGINSSPGNTLGAPSAAPPSAAPAPPPSTAPGANSGSSPSGSPSPAPLPNPGPLPQPQPQLQKQSDPPPNPFPFAEPAPKPGLNLGAPPGTSPAPTPAPAPSNFNSGNKAPAPAPGTSPSIKKDPAPITAPSPYPDTGFQPDQFSPNPLVDNPLEPKKFAPNPNTGNPEPNAPPKTEPPKSPAPAPAPNDDLFKQIQNLIGPVTIALAGITALVQPNAIKSAANAATCEAFAPGGCNAPIATNAQNAANNSANNNVLLARILAAIELLQTLFLAPILAGVNLINSKLGPVMAGVNGIGGFLGRLNTSLGVDRVINLVTTAGVIHNCMMLSTSISDTLFSTLDNIFAIPSLIKNPDGETVDTRETFTKYLDGMFAGIFGTTEWIAIKNQWKAYSTIYNTGSQVFGNIRDIFDETSQIQEVTRNWVAELGNGLQDEGVIGEANWDVKDPTKQIKGKYFARLQRIAEGLEQVENVAEDLEQITSSARNIVETANEIKENTTAISAAVTEANKAAKLDRDAKEEGLELPNFSLEDLF